MRPKTEIETFVSNWGPKMSAASRVLQIWPARWTDWQATWHAMLGRLVLAGAK